MKANLVIDVIVRNRLVDDIIEAARKVVADEYCFGHGAESRVVRALRLALVELDIAETR